MTTTGSRTALFPNCPAFVNGNPESAGFGDLHASEHFRAIEREAVCRVPVARDASFAEPCLMVRAIAPEGRQSPYLAVSVDGRHVGVHVIPGYGSYFFPLPRDPREAQVRDSLEVTLCALDPPGSRDRCQIRVYDVRVVDLGRNDFPERHQFFEQAKIFEPAGGYLYEILAGYPFPSNARILDVGAGLGWTTVLLSALSGARVWCIDLHEYARMGGVNFKTELRQRFERHRSALKNIPLLASRADSASLDRAVERCTFLTMNAEHMLLPDRAFDFVFSLNAFEHIGRPDLALSEVYRVLRPGGHALLQFSPLYYSDAGSHLPMTVGFNRPWAHLLMTRAEIKEAIRDSGGSINEVDSILDSLNGWTPRQFREAVGASDFRLLLQNAKTGFTLEGAEGSPEFSCLSARHSREDLTTFEILWFMEKPVSA